ncbi:MAG: hypothetical protein K6C30_01370, partial [Bacteroidaceae bacterium]|nr:hypothetical protein [Bacteroidaceae bacterium]
GVYGQHDYVVGDIIPDAIHDTYEAITSKPTENQATVVEAYVAKDEVIYIIDGTEHHAYKGTSISRTDYDQLTDEQKACFAAAHLCTSTIDLGNNEYVFYGDLLTDEEISTYKATYKTYLISQGYSDSDAQTKANTDFATDISDAWYCTVAGKYGGDYYEASKNYRALDAWCSMPESDRANFTFNYDALDLLIDDNYAGNPQNYDGYDNAEERLYSPQKAINYLATYNGEENLTYTDEKGANQTIEPGSSIDNEAYEDLPNEKRHYKSITVDASGYYYIVKVAFTVGDVPYSVGTTLSFAVYGSLDADQKNNVDVVPLTKGEGESNTYHYCREAYKINEKGEGVAVTDINDRTHLSGSVVSVGTIISDDEFVKLTNKQTNFTIHGTVPVETSTLYVAKESDINNLSEDKIITVIYEYTYEESDATGNNVDEITEQHIVNIHLQFRSGVPEIGELQKPNIVLPGTSVGLKQPNVTPGAYEIIGGGWEMYTNETDANNHTNGVPYENNVTKLYWYQDGYYVTYYAKSYLGKTYSNEVQFAVANYHDMDEVMQHKDHHMYVDYPVVKRPSKIYIDDRDCKSDETKSELDLLKDFYDLSLLTTEPTEGTLRGHKLLNNHITQCDNLDIILRSDVEPKAYTNWTPIGDDRKCFSGTLHGDGYTISGLNNSLFNYLCGSVYNLGVTGTFTGSGIAEHGSGYIENCWVSTSSTEARTNKPVLGDPMAARDVKQIVNCYYQEDDDATNKYENHTGTHGIPTRKPAEAFYNGEVAYDLNGFYLFKRYCDPNVTSGTAALTYKYFTVDADNTLSDVPKTGYYADKMTEARGTTDPVYCSSGYNGILYVEDRFDDGDFIYAAGTIPEGENERYWSDEDVSTYYPIWPDDYIFFGQRLNYGHADDQEHQPLPSYVIRLDNRILTVKGNRVYRAPAYFQSSDMKSAHFNPDAYLAELSKDGTRTAYPNMTAIDFTGCNDVKYGYRLGLHSNSFFPPLLDDDGLTSIVNIDETKNLLFYIPQATSSDTDPETKTNLVVTDYLPDATYAETNTTYRTVAVSQRIINGHRVVKNNAGYAEGSYTAPVDHRLVDKQDFNAPIEYTFASGRRMWYQRTPDTFVDRTKGWDGISIPFSPEVVTTQTKGELTHFYTGSTTGHEYWLREYDSGGAVDSENENIFVANFRYPDAGTSTKTYTNTFLWDYYYSQNPKSEGKAGQDINTDEYQKKDNDRKYYSETRTYSDYAYAAAGKPYIIGLPGDTYYEFDLSGSFIPEHTYLSIDQLPTQTITFASKAAATIAISDTELKNGKVTADGYVFQPNYLATTLGSGKSYMMESDGSAYKQTTAATASVPFRPYITPAPGGGVKGVTDIIFSSVSSSLDEEAERGNGDADSGKLLIRSKRGRILVKSNCSSTTVVHIVSAAGALIRTFDIAPGQSVETPVAAGVFLVNKKKIFVN